MDLAQFYLWAILAHASIIILAIDMQKKSDPKSFYERTTYASFFAHLTVVAGCSIIWPISFGWMICSFIKKEPRK